MGVAGVDRARIALDVGCGTGLSAKALAEIADQVVAIDSVAQMLALAPAGQRVEYVVGSAEHLPFENATFDAVTVSSSVHWFDHQAFFVEASRTLVDRGWLAIYDHYFLGHILDDPAFAKWSTDRYLAEYPKGLVAEAWR